MHSFRRVFYDEQYKSERHVDTTIYRSSGAPTNGIIETCNHNQESSVTQNTPHGSMLRTMGGISQSQTMNYFSQLVLDRSTNQHHQASRIACAVLVIIGRRIW